MSIAKVSLLAWPLLAFSFVSFAKPVAQSSVEAMPLNSPGDWIGTGDYPATALRYKLTGTTAFRLTIDATGKPKRCDIVESSGYDILDNTTCRRLMSYARFLPALDRAGTAVEGTFTSGVRWALPESLETPVSETSTSMVISADPAGKITSCKLVLDGSTLATDLSATPCKSVMQSPPAMGLELRGNYQGESAEIEYQQATVFTDALRDRVLAPKSGYEQRGLNVYRFTVITGGKIGQCEYKEQRGSEYLAHDFCAEAREQTFDPPFSSFNENGVATGWHIVRVLLKN